MKKLIFLAVCLLASGMPAFGQTYQELCDRAVTYTEQDSLPQAETYIRRALKLEPANPHNALLFSNLGTIQRRQRKYEKALESYNFALNIAPRAVPILLNWGVTTWHKPIIRWCWIWRKTTKKPC